MSYQVFMHQLEKETKGKHFGCLHNVAQKMTPNSKATSKMGFFFCSLLANAILTTPTPCDLLATHSPFLPVHTLTEPSKLKLNTNSTF
jgi:hypothetical protein